MTTGFVKRWFPLLVIVVLVLLAWVSGLADAVNLQTIKDERESLLALASAHPFSSVLCYMALYIVCVVLSLPIATLLTLLGGFLFGSWLGTLVIVISATIGATALFLVARSALGETLRDKAGPLYRKISANMDENATGYMLFMRLVPLFPFFLVNIVPALFNVRLVPYVLTTFFGIIPGTFVYANAGRALGTIDSLRELASPGVLMAFTLLGILALVPSMYKRFRKQPA